VNEIPRGTTMFIRDFFTLLIQTQRHDVTATSFLAASISAMYTVLPFMCVGMYVNGIPQGTTMFIHDFFTLLIQTQRHDVTATSFLAASISAMYTVLTVCGDVCV
jgi:hypothetical protein